MPSKEALLEAFVPGASLPIRGTMLKIYGYGITDPDYVEIALDRLEAMGCADVREIYRDAVSEWKAEHDAMLDRVSGWYVEWIQKEESRKDGELSRKIRSMSKRELIKLQTELLTQGIVADPEEFADLMIQFQQA